MNRKTSEPGYHEIELQIALDPGDPRNALPSIDAGRRSILDIGCGAGQTLIAANQHGATACGIDMDLDALRAGHERHTHIKFIYGSGEALPFQDGAFDFIICRVALPYMNIPVALAEIHRVLRPDGEVWLLLHSLSFFRRRLRRSLRSLDWKDVIFLAYVALNSAVLHFGLQFRFPRRELCESFQTPGSIRSILTRMGFHDIRIDHGGFFIVTARRR
jgi:ubiquinone/menaquinone biosynthesis C-methylase UbiE